ncbi:MAG: hypothetical protein M0T85_00870 [Dehalococcoidales bacterium]|nr:hypothetical protein [Dehalococcoidales bacterium]
MLVLDLRWFIFGFLLILIVALSASIWLDRQLRRKTSIGAVGLGDDANAGGHALMPSMREMGLVLEQAPFGVLLLEGARVCRYANPVARRLLVLAAPDYHLPETSWSRLLDADRTAARQERAAPYRYRSVPVPSDQLQGSDESAPASKFIRWWVSPLGHLDLVFLLDVTSQQRAEEAGRSLINDLSHEMRTPLATILTHLEVLSLPVISQEIRGQSIHLLKAEAHRLARLVNLMLELGRLETTAEIERRPVDLLALVEGVAALDEGTRAKATAGTSLAAPDGFAIQAPGRPNALELAGRGGAEEPRLDLRRAAWEEAQIGFRVYQDWLGIINGYKTTRGLPVYITSANTFAPDDGTPPAQNYPRGWLTAALEVIDQEPQVQALAWFIDGPLGDN